MIFRDNKSRDCGANEVTELTKEEEPSGSHRRTLLVKLETRLLDIQFVLSKVKSPWHKLRYRDPILPAGPSAILPDAIFPRRIISYPIANYRMLSGCADFSGARFDLRRDSPRFASRPGNKRRTDRTILPGFSSTAYIDLSERRTLTFNDDRSD